MCGIAGLATPGETPSRDLLERMVRRLTHRGPDGEGFYLAPGVGLGMRRLAVIDLETGDQPMATPDGSVQVVFNGEIYNHHALRADLETQGYVFRTQSDTEVLPYLYEVHGVEFLSRLNGMFAIALWDRSRQRLLLARDRVGIKPLFYASVGERLFFGSEIKAILATGVDLGRLDPLGLHQYLSLEYTLTPRTLFEGIHKLPAGGWLTWEAGHLGQGRFWELPDTDPDAEIDLEQTAALLRQTLCGAVQRQLEADVPLGTFLSGGIDSSILVAAISQVSDQRPLTFSVGFGDSSYDELRFSRLVAETFDTDHHEEILAPDYLDHLETVVEHLDQPIGDFSVFPTLLVSQMARRHVTVALGGDGGDELFAGYHTYRAQRLARPSLDLLPRGMQRALARWAARIPLSPEKRGLRNSLARFLEGGNWDPGLQHLRWMLFLDDERARLLYTQDFYRQIEGRLEELLMESLDSAHSDRLHDQMTTDVRLYLSENILTKVDLMSMAVSLEVRVPYLDNEVLDLALRLPSSAKWRSGQQKWILKHAFRDVLPQAILHRNKEGFSIPMKKWLAGQWNPLMHQLLEDDTLYRVGWVRRDGVAELMHEHESGRRNHSHLLWALMLFQLWSARYFETPARMG